MTLPTKGSQKSKTNAEDDEEDDEDYNPAEDQEAGADDDDDDMVGVEPETNVSFLTPTQLQSVDAAFDQLFGFKWGTSFHLPDERPLTKREKLLCQVFGSDMAARILRSNASSTRAPKRTIMRKKQDYKSLIATKPQKVSNTASASSRKSETQQAERPVVKSAGGVDNLLKQLAAPEKVTTVAKTSADWDQFKDTTGLGEKLEEQAGSKDAYLKKQDFLTRVDHRKFDIERQERDRDRAKRK